MLLKLCNENDLRMQMPTLSDEFRKVGDGELNLAIIEATQYVYHDLDGRYDIQSTDVIPADFNDLPYVIRLITSIRAALLLWERYNIGAGDNQQTALKTRYQQWRDQMTEGALLADDGSLIPTRNDPSVSIAPLERDTVAIYGTDPDTYRTGWPPVVIP